MLLVSAGYGLMLVRMPAPAPTAVSLEHAEIMILPPGDPNQELASVGSPDSAAAQASNALETAQVAKPTEVPVVEELKPALEPIREANPDVATQQMAMLEIEPLKDPPTKRETVRTKEIERKKKEKVTERKKEPPKPKSASSPASRGQAGSGGGRSNATGQSVAAYASSVRSILVSRTQRIKNLRSTGKVGLVFRINSAGQLASLDLRSSGSAEIDRAVRAALQGISFPPPPNGAFSGSITITVR